MRQTRRYAIAECAGSNTVGARTTCVHTAGSKSNGNTADHARIAAGASCPSCADAGKRAAPKYAIPTSTHRRFSYPCGNTRATERTSTYAAGTGTARLRSASGKGSDGTVDHARIAAGMSCPSCADTGKRAASKSAISAPTHRRFSYPPRITRVAERASTHTAGTGTACVYSANDKNSDNAADHARSAAGISYRTSCADTGKRAATSTENAPVTRRRYTIAP